MVYCADSIDRLMSRPIHGTNFRFFFFHIPFIECLYLYPEKPWSLHIGGATTSFYWRAEQVVGDIDAADVPNTTTQELRTRAVAFATLAVFPCINVALSSPPRTVPADEPGFGLLTAQTLPQLVRPEALLVKHVASWPAPGPICSSKAVY